MAVLTSCAIDVMCKGSTGGGGGGEGIKGVRKFLSEILNFHWLLEEYYPLIETAHLSTTVGRHVFKRIYLQFRYVFIFEQGCG